MWQYIKWTTSIIEQFAGTGVLLVARSGQFACSNKQTKQMKKNQNNLPFIVRIRKNNWLTVTQEHITPSVSQLIYGSAGYNMQIVGKKFKIKHYIWHEISWTWTFKCIYLYSEVQWEFHEPRTEIYPFWVSAVLVMMVPAGIITTKTILTPKGLETDKKP